MDKKLDILLQRSHVTIPWGFTIHCGLEFPFVSSVTYGSLASQYLHAGDKVLEIQQENATGLLPCRFQQHLEGDGRSLRLLVQKRDHLVKNRPLSSMVRLGMQQDTNKPVLTVEAADDIQVDLRVEYRQTDYNIRCVDGEKKETGTHNSNSNHRRMKVLLEECIKSKTGGIDNKSSAEDQLQERRQQTCTDGAGGPPPPPSFPGALPGRRLQTEMPDRSNEPPAAIQNAMMTKDKKPFTYTPGGLDLSQIRSPRMQRRINRNACAEEMTGEPAPTVQAASPQPGGPPPPPPPLPPGAVPGSHTLPKVQRPQQPCVTGFDPNEILQRASRLGVSQNQEQQQQQQQQHQVPPPPPLREVREVRESPVQTPQMQSPPPRQPGHIYVPQVQPKLNSEPASIYIPTVPGHGPNQGRSQLGSLYIPPVTNANQESPPATPSTASSAAGYGYTVQSPQSPPSSTSSPTSPLPQVELNKAPTPWMTQHRNPQQTVPTWASREPASASAESPKPSGTRIIPIQIEGREPVNQSAQYNANSNNPRSASQPANTRVIPIQMEGSSSPQPNQQRWNNQGKFSPMTPQSPTPYSPPNMDGNCGAGDSSPQWAPVQSRSFRVLQKVTDSELDGPQQQQQGYQHPQQAYQPPPPPPQHHQGYQHPQQAYQPPPPPPQHQQQGYQHQYQPQLQGHQQPEYGNYNTAGVPVSQLRKMQLSEDDRALMDKFKAQADNPNSDCKSNNGNSLYKGRNIPSRVFKLLDDSVDDETYLHREADPRYRGAAIPSRAFRMLQTMTDTAGDLPQQVPRNSPRGQSSRPQSQIQQDVPQGPYVAPSEQQVHEPRKYMGGSIPSRSFRMLQAMTGQEGTARNQSSPNSPSGRETPVSGIGRWCPSPAPTPSPMDPYWGYYPPDPYLIYNYITDMNAAYGFPPPHTYPSPHPPPPAYHFQRYHNNYMSDSDEQGYSSTDEMAQYYANYRRNMGYPPYQANGEQFYHNGMEEVQRSPTRSPKTPKTPNETVTPVKKGDKVKNKKSEKCNGVDQKPESKKNSQDVKEKPNQPSEKKEAESSDESVSSSDEESDTDTEVEDEKDGTTKKIRKSSQKLNKNGSLQALKSVSDVNIYTSESSATVTAEEWEDCESKLGDEDQDDDEEEVEEEEEEEDEEEASSEEEEVVVNGSEDENLRHQLSIIYEESDVSDLESLKHAGSKKSGRSARSTTKSVTSESGESTATLDNSEEESDEDVLDSESSVTVRLPLQLKFGRTDNDEEVTTVIVGDSEMKRGAHQPITQSRDTKEIELLPELIKIEPEVIEIGNEDEDADDYKSDDADVSFTFSIPTRSNSVITVVSNSDHLEEEHRSSDETGDKKQMVQETAFTKKHVAPPLQYPKTIESVAEVKNAVLHKEEVTTNLKKKKSKETKPPKDADPVIEAEVTVSLSLPLRKTKTKGKDKNSEEEETSKTEESDSTHCEDDSSSTSVQSGDTVVKMKEDTDEDTTGRISEDENTGKIETFKSWMDRENSQDWNKTEKTVGSVSEAEVVEEEEDEEEDDDEGEDDEDEEANCDCQDQSSYEAGVGKLEAMISSLLQKTKETVQNGSEKNVSHENGKSDTHRKLKKKDSKDSQEESEDDSGVTSDMSAKHQNSETDDTESDFSELSKMTQFQRASTHSRLFKLLQEECEKSDDEEENENDNENEEERTLTRSDSKESKSSSSPVHLDKTKESLVSRKERLTLPLNQNTPSEVDSLSSSSGVTSPSSPTVTDRLVKELVQSLLHKKKGKKFRKLPLAKLHAAALRILQEDMDPYDTSSASASGDDGFYMSPVQRRIAIHSQPPVVCYEAIPGDPRMCETVPEAYGENYYDYLEYYNTWGNAAGYYMENEYDILPSRAFRMLQAHPCGYPPPPMDGFKAKCPRIPNGMPAYPPPSGRETPSMNGCPRVNTDEADVAYSLSFADKRERVSKVLEKSART